MHGYYLRLLGSLMGEMGTQSEASRGWPQVVLLSVETTRILCFLNVPFLVQWYQNINRKNNKKILILHWNEWKIQFKKIKFSTFLFFLILLISECSEWVIHTRMLYTVKLVSETVYVTLFSNLSVCRTRFNVSSSDLHRWEMLLILTAVGTNRCSVRDL